MGPKIPENENFYSKLFFLLCPSLDLPHERLKSIKLELSELGAEVDTSIDTSRIPCYVCNTRTTPMYHIVSDL